MNNDPETETLLQIIAGMIAAVVTVWKGIPILCAIASVIRKSVMFVPLAFSAPFRIVAIADKQTKMETRQERMESALVELHATATAEIETSPHGIWFSDHAGRCINVNQRLCQIIGRGASEIVGNEWMNVVHPDDRERVIVEWTDAVRLGHSFRSNYAFVAPDGRRIPVRVVAAVRRHYASHETIGFLGKVELA